MWEESGSSRFKMVEVYFLETSLLPPSLSHKSNVDLPASPTVKVLPSRNPAGNSPRVAATDGGALRARVGRGVK